MLDEAPTEITAADFDDCFESDTALALSRCSEGVKTAALADWPVTWDELREAVSKPEVGDKDGPYYVRGRCAPSDREDANLAHPALLIIDGDKSFDPETGEIVPKCVTPEAAHEALRELGIPHILHTSHSHDPANGINKWRALIHCPMKNGAELHAMSNWIIAQLNERDVPIVWVKEMGALSQPWYFPRIRSADAPFNFYSYDLEEGEEPPLGRALVESVTEKWRAKDQLRGVTAERGSERNEDTIIGRFMTMNDNADFIVSLLEEHGGCDVVGTDVVNRKLAYRLLPQGSTSGAAGVHVYRGKGDGTWLLYSHNDSFQLPGGKSKALDAFGVYQWLVHGNDWKAAIEAAKRMVAKATGEPDEDEAEALIEEAMEIASERDRVKALKEVAKKIYTSPLIDKSDTGKLIKRIAPMAGVSVADLRDDLKALQKQKKTQPANNDYMRTEDGQIICNAFNTSKAVGSADVVGAVVAFDTFRERIVAHKPDGSVWENFQDHMYNDFRIRLDLKGFERTTPDLVRGAVHTVSRANQFDSLRDWAETLKWDGKARVNYFCVNHFSCAEDAYAKEVGRYIWTALAARAMLLNPAGEKADMVPILTGDQGLLKSTMLASMAPDESMFVELDLGDSQAELVRKMRGRVIWELGELNGLSKRSREHLKFLFSMKKDTHRDNYAEYSEERPRRGLYFGTTNEEHFLDDPTGHRRYLPLRVGLSGGLVVLDAETRDQLWAEGIAIFKQEGICFRRAEELARDKHADHISLDPWQERLGRWLAEEQCRMGDETDPPEGSTNSERTDLTTERLACSVIGLHVSQLDKRVANRVGGVMRMLGYRLAKSVMIGKNEKGTAWRKA